MSRLALVMAAGCYRLIILQSNTLVQASSQSSAAVFLDPSFHSRMRTNTPGQASVLPGVYRLTRGHFSTPSPPSERSRRLLLIPSALLPPSRGMPPGNYFPEVRVDLMCIRERSLFYLGHLEGHLLATAPQDVGHHPQRPLPRNDVLLLHLRPHGLRFARVVCLF